MDSLHPGQPVWARMGRYGWRPAVVLGGTLSSVRIRFESGRGGNGRRSARLLMPRDPAWRGKDKPAARWEPQEARA